MGLGARNEFTRPGDIGGLPPHADGRLGMWQALDRGFPSGFSTFTRWAGRPLFMKMLFPQSMRGLIDPLLSDL